MATDGEFLLSILEQVGPKVSASNRKVGRVLNRRPPVIRKTNAGSEPMTNSLLAGLRFPELSELHGKTGLAAANSDGTLERSKVRFIHEARLYTNPFVRVNNPICVTDEKSACMVPGMSNAKKSAVVKLPRKRAKKTPPNPIGADGKTLAQRLEIAMAYKSGSLRRPYTESELVRDANISAGGTETDVKVSQQSVNAIRRGLSSRSAFTPYLAEACGVRMAWLAGGVGPMTN